MQIVFRYQEVIRTARGDNEVALFNAKRRRIIYTLVCGLHFLSA